MCFFLNFRNKLRFHFPDISIKLILFFEYSYISDILINQKEYNDTSLDVNAKWFSTAI